MANVDVNVTFNVAPLPDNAVWFANSAAWSNYWSQQDATITIPAATTLTSGVVNQASTNAFVDPGVTGTLTATFSVDLQGNGVFVNVQIPLESSFAELKTQMETLVADYKVLKSAMVTAGLITTA